MRVQDREQGRARHQSLGIAHQLGQDVTLQGLEVAPELPDRPMEGGGVEPRYDRVWKSFTLTPLYRRSSVPTNSLFSRTFLTCFTEDSPVATTSQTLRLWFA